MYLSKMILSTIVSLALFGGGVVILLFSKIPVWSVLLGIGASQAGIIMLILTFERLSRESNTDDAEIEKELEEFKFSHQQSIHPVKLKKNKIYAKNT